MMPSVTASEAGRAQVENRSGQRLYRDVEFRRGVSELYGVKSFETRHPRG
jgi:hypothetical protein